MEVTICFSKHFCCIVMLLYSTLQNNTANQGHWKGQTFPDKWQKYITCRCIHYCSTAATKTFRWMYVSKVRFIFVIHAIAFPVKHKLSKTESTFNLMVWCIKGCATDLALKNHFCTGDTPSSKAWVTHSNHQQEFIKEDTNLDYNLQWSL